MYSFLHFFWSIADPNINSYENYSGNLGIQTLTDILFTHYGPNPVSQEFNGEFCLQNMVTYVSLAYLKSLIIPTIPF